LARYVLLHPPFKCQILSTLLIAPFSTPPPSTPQQNHQAKAAQAARLPPPGPLALRKQQQRATAAAAAAVPTVITRLPQHLGREVLANGVLLVDKPQDWSVLDTMRAVKHAVKAARVGHAGALDEMATGLVIVCLGGWVVRFEGLRSLGL